MTPAEDLRAAAAVVRQRPPSLWPPETVREVADWLDKAAEASGCGQETEGAMAQAQSILGELPVADADGLTASVLAGRECARCAKRVPLPDRIVARTPAGDLVRVCHECKHGLEAVR